MRKLNEAVDRFCAMHPRFGIPGLMRYIVGANVVVYFLSLFAGPGTLSFLAMIPERVLHGEIWRIFTYVLMPTNGGFWLVVSLMFYYWLGQSLEQLWGTAKFNFYYLSGTILTAVAYILVYFIHGIGIPLMGASFVNTAMFLAYAMTYPDAIVNLFFILPLKIKWLAWIELALYGIDIVRSAMMGLWGMALLPVIALLNLIVFFAPDLQRKADQVRARNRPQAIKFRKAVQEQQKQKGYTHKCCICGKTDTDYPDMQFRYCSKCKGYHCFCEEHIYNHTHFTE